MPHFVLNILMFNTSGRHHVLYISPLAKLVMIWAVWRCSAIRNLTLLLKNSSTLSYPHWCTLLMRILVHSNELILLEKLKWSENLLKFHGQVKTHDPWHRSQTLYTRRYNTILVKNWCRVVILAEPVCLSGQI